MIDTKVLSEVSTHRQTPRIGLVLSSILSAISIGVLAICLSQRVLSVKSWSKVNITRWLILAIYVDSILFVVITTVLSHGFGLNTSVETCSTAILLCLVCYMSTKIIIYYYLVEKAYIVSGVDKPRLRSKLYLFNCIGMLIPYVVVVVLNFVYRIAAFDSQGLCIIGMEKKAMMPLIIFDVLVNVWLTALFIVPLRKLYSYKNPDSDLRTVTFRTFIGSCTTLAASIINLTILMVLKGEAAWICLLCCNFDVLFSSCVLHWVTSKDNARRRSVQVDAALGSRCVYCNPSQTVPFGTQATNPLATSNGEKDIFCGVNSSSSLTTITSTSCGSKDAWEETKLVKGRGRKSSGYGTKHAAKTEEPTFQHTGIMVERVIEWQVASNIDEEMNLESPGKESVPQRPKLKRCASSQM